MLGMHSRSESSVCKPKHKDARSTERYNITSFSICCCKRICKILFEDKISKEEMLFLYHCRTLMLFDFEMFYEILVKFARDRYYCSHTDVLLLGKIFFFH